MIDNDGHVALVDFGLAKLHVSEYKGAKTMAGSPQYTAPELLLPKTKRSYGKAADWWSLGILLYEMSVGKSPFYDSNIEKMYHKIQNDPLTFPDRPELPPDLKDVLVGFLQKDPTKRLGSKIGDILTHPYFKGIDWDLLLQKKITPPWKPNLASPLDVDYVDTEFTDMDVHREVQSPTDKSSRPKGFLSLVSSRGGRKSAPPEQDPTFKDFTYFCEDPDALVEVTNLVHELHPTPPPPPPPPAAGLLNDEASSSDGESDLGPDPSGTPLSSFVENGRLDPVALSRSPEHVRKSLQQLESEMAQSFERLEVTITRERPAHLQTSAAAQPEVIGATYSSVSVPATPTDSASTAGAYPIQRRSGESNSSSSSGSQHDPSLQI
ncbi:hypothetical protein PINS_up000483 [Pythium insidiosum]|nr:hypothetical protein PINS_up000483 [Pythium insidiosum]